MALTQISTGGIKDDAVTDAKLPANSVGNSEMKDDAVGVAALSATGTASSSTFLRGDNSWVTPTDTNTQLAFANDANNRVVTGDGSGGLNGEANLTFDGTTLTASGNTTAANNTNTDANIIAGSQTLIRQKGNHAGIGGDAYPSQIVSGTGGGDLELYTINSNCDVVVGTQATERFRIESDGDVKINDGNLVIGTAGHGIDFSAVSHAGGMTSELLDSYEEGTFTPTISAVSAGWDSRTGTYTKVGDLVTVFIHLNTASGGSTNGDQVAITSLPFTAVNNNGAAAVTVGYHSGLISADYDFPFLIVSANTTSIMFHKGNGNAFTGNDVATSDFSLHVSCTYKAA